MKDKCCICGATNFVRCAVILGNSELYASLFNERLMFCDDCYPKWDKVRKEYYKALNKIATKAEREHKTFITNLISKMKKMKGE